MSKRPVRPQQEPLDGRCLPSGIPALTISSVALAEGSGGQTAFVFTVSLSAPSARRISVDYRSADASTTAGSDYQAVSGKLHFAPGQTTRTITVWVAGDTAAETNESFFIDLSRASNATIATGRGWGTIRDDDGYVPPPPPPPWPSLPDPAWEEAL